MSSCDYSTVTAGSPAYLLHLGWGPSSYTKVIVAKVTKIHITLEGGRKFRKSDGFEVKSSRGGTILNTILVAWTPELEASIQVEEQLKALQYQVKKALEEVDTRNLSEERCQQILNLLSSESST